MLGDDHLFQEVHALREENSELRKVVNAACRLIGRLSHLHSKEDIELSEAVANWTVYSTRPVRTN